MQRRPALLVVLGVGLLVAGLAGFPASDQTYEYAPYAVDAVPPGETVYRYEALAPVDREFVHDAGVNEDGGTGSDGFTVELDEAHDPRDVLDLYSQPDTLRSPGSYVSYDGTVYHLHGDSLAGFEPLFLWPKYLLLIAGVAIGAVGVGRGTDLRPLAIASGHLAGTIGFVLVEWFGSDGARHLLPLATGVAVTAGVLLVARRTSWRE